MARHRNDGLRKVCACSRRTWAKCEHPWHFNFKWNGVSYRFSLDREVSRRLTGKAEARAEADRLRIAIREGTFRQRSATEPAPATPDAITFEKFCEKYFERAVPESKISRRNDRSILDHLCAFPVDGATLGAKALRAITEDDLEAVMADLVKKGRAASTRNKFVQVIRHAFKWAVRKGYLEKAPLSEESAIKRTKHASRTRRLQPGEEAALLQHATPRLHRLITAALDTGARLGELLKLTWADVNLKGRLLTIRAETAKDRESRTLPLSARLVKVLKPARLDPAGEDLPATAHVFGDELGRPVESIKKSWETAVLKAHGHEPIWLRHALAAESRDVLRAINLHFHDLRHEAGSRWLEEGWPLHRVKEMLGHADIKTTSGYLNTTAEGLAESMKLSDTKRRRKGARCKKLQTKPERGLPPLRKSEAPAASNSLIH